MSPLRACVLLLAGWLAGCSRDAAPVVATSAAGEGIEWQGMLACADCDGIQTRLQLRNDARRLYTLDETYLADNGDARFTETGQWQRERDLLRLRGDAGAVRVYALLADGRLQPRDAHGRPLQPRQADFLMPMTTAP